MFFFFFYDDYVAIIGDIIDSKKIKYRQDVQKKLDKTLADVNEKYKESIASKFEITLSDEFQGLLKERKNIMNIISDIELAMYPTKIKFGIGVGKISTDINYEKSSKVDGPAFYYAREMIDKLDKMQHKYEGNQSNIMIYTGDKNKDIDSLINSILSICTSLKYKWTSRQYEIIKAYIESGGNQYHTADILKINQSNVSKSLKNSNYFTYISAIKNVNDFLSKERVEEGV